MAWEKFKYAKTDTVLPALILVVDELAQFVDDVPHSQMRKADEFQGNIQKIARLGRSAHVHVILATQSASSNLFPPSLKNNIAFRNVCGRVEANISRMAIDSEEAESLPLTPGSYLGYSKGETQSYRGWYTPTKKVLSLGTVKPGYDPETGLSILEEDEFDFSKPIEDDNDYSYEDSNGSEDDDIDEPTDESEDEYSLPDTLSIDELLGNGDDDIEDSVEEQEEEDVKPAPTFKLRSNSPKSNNSSTSFKLNRQKAPDNEPRGSITIE